MKLRHGGHGGNRNAATQVREPGCVSRMAYFEFASPRLAGLFGSARRPWIVLVGIADKYGGILLQPLQIFRRGQALILAFGCLRINRERANVTQEILILDLCMSGGTSGQIARAGNSRGSPPPVTVSHNVRLTSPQITPNKILAIESHSSFLTRWKAISEAVTRLRP